jgi:hypothetical protein
VKREADKLWAKERLRERLIELNDDQHMGYIKNLMGLLSQTKHFPLPQKNYLERILTGHIPCARKLAANIIRAAEQEDLTILEVRALTDRYFERRRNDANG